MKKLVIISFFALTGCGTLSNIGGPDPQTYEPVVAQVNEPTTYINDQILCRNALTNIPSGINAAGLATASGKSAVQSLPALAASPPLYGVDVGAATGTELFSQVTGSRAEKLRAFVSCVRQATTEDKSAILADPY